MSNDHEFMYKTGFQYSPFVLKQRVAEEEWTKDADGGQNATALRDHSSGMDFG